MRGIPRLIRGGVLSLVLLLPCSTAVAIEACGGDTTPVSVGIVPWLSGPASAAWTRELGKHLLTTACLDARFGSEGDFITHFKAIADLRYDVVLEPTHLALLLVQRYGYKVVGYRPLVSDGFVLFTRDDLNLRSLSQLDGQTVALPDPLALASLAAEFRLAQEGVKAKFVYLGRHDRVLAALAGNQAQAGVVSQNVFDAVKDGGVRFRELMPLLPSRVSTGMVLTRPGLDPGLQRLVHDAFRSFDAAGNALLPSVVVLTDAEEVATRQTIAPYVDMLAERLRQAGVQVLR